jgi:phage FluMu protein Com
LSRRRNFGEKLGEWFGRHHLRCRSCRKRFLLRTWSWKSWLYARCPQCHRTDLTTWLESHYQLTWLKVAGIRLGGKRLRCDPCRCNFVSFRLRKEKYRRHKHSGSEVH